MDTRRKSPSSPRARRDRAAAAPVKGKARSAASRSDTPAGPPSEPGAKTRAKSRSAPSPLRPPRFRLWLGIVALALAALGWLFRPWSEYSPYETLRSFDPRSRLAVLRGVDEILPYRMIGARAEVEPLRRREAPIDAGYEWQGERKLVERFIEETAVTGLFVLDDGAIVHERYRLGADAETRFTTFGLAGGVVAALIGAAVHDGLIASLDDTVETYAPRYRGTDYGDASLRALLAKSAGFARVEGEGALGPELRGLLLRAAVLGGDPNRVVRGARRVRPEGEALDLAAADTQALAAVVSAVYAAPFADVVERKIWGPYGMTGPATWSQHAAGESGVALGFCCWNARLQDIARFGEVLRRDGDWQGVRLFPEGWIAAAAQPSAPFAEPGADPALDPWGLGLHLYVPADSRGEFLLAGEYGQYLWVDRRLGVVVVLTAADPDWRGRRAEATAVLRAIVAAAEEL
jgi:hypothetical protein